MAALAPTGDASTRCNALANRRSRPSSLLHVVAVAVRDVDGSSAASDGVRGEHPGLERLGDPLARHRVDDRCGVAHVEHAAVGEPCRIERGGDRPRSVRVLGLGALAEHVAHAGTREQVGPEMMQVLPGHARSAQHAEPDVRAAVRQREDPRVSREQVALEEHPLTSVLDATEVLAERVPRPEIAFAVGLAQAAHRRPVPIGGGDERGVECGPVVELGPHAPRSDVQCRERASFADVDSPAAGVRHELCIEIEAGDNDRVPAVGRHRE